VVPRRGKRKEPTTTSIAQIEERDDCRKAINIGLGKKETERRLLKKTLAGTIEVLVPGKPSAKRLTTSKGKIQPRKRGMLLR